MTSAFYRSHHCGELTPEQAEQSVRLAGWLHVKRDHGGVLFVELRDHYGITQCVVQPDSEAFAVCNDASVESVLRIDGLVRRRSDDTVNAAMATGSIEVHAQTAVVLSRAEALPLPVAREQPFPEDTRLRYRYLDLRRSGMHQRLMLRAAVIGALRREMTAAGFTEHQTPILTSSSPEGARDFLVPSRTHPGRFYALPQAPQQYKQMLMMAGFDRYFQIAPCFRNEDARSDRSPGEFYQLDFEMSFVTQEDVWQTLEKVLFRTFTEFAGQKRVSSPPFERITYADAMDQFGTDKPDLRNPLRITNVTDRFRGEGFALFARQIEVGSVVRAIRIPDGASQGRSFFDRANRWAQQSGQAGLGYGWWRSGEPVGPILSKLSQQAGQQLFADLQAKPDDGVVFVCGRRPEASAFAGEARQWLAEQLDRIDRDVFAFCWVIDMPMFEQDEATGAIAFSHNPFSMPQGGLEALETQDPLTIKAMQYDIVCNGVELSSGAIRNHLPEVMLKAFEIAGYPAQEVEKRFGGMLTALRYGAPPHGGSAPGIDRMVMLLAGVESLREITAFPLNGQAEDPLMGTPAFVDEEQLRELHLKVCGLKGLAQ